MAKQPQKKTLSEIMPLMCAALLLLTGCAGTRTTKHEKWVQAIMSAMTVEQKVGQLMIPGYAPRFYHTYDPQFKRLIKLVKDYHVGAVMHGRGMPYEVGRSIDRLQQEADLPLLVMSDVEWGLAMRVNQSTRFLENMAIGATGNEDYAYEMGRITGKEAKAIGVHVGFAPVMDVNNNPDNIIINTRSYGEDPKLVSRLGAAFIRGMQENGVYATAKHYPGHGDTDVDSHLNLPTIEASKARVRRIELPPFKSAVDAGAKSVMVGHLTYGAFAQMQGRPATLDPYFIQQVLRKEMGFKGLVITDAMEMGGITEHFWSGAAAVMAINAGIDMLLLPPDFETTYSFVVQAVSDGRIPIERIDEAVRKILQAKAELGLTSRPVFDLAELERVLSSPQHLRQAEEIANASVTLLRDDQEIIPFRAEQLDSVLVVTITDEEASRASNLPLSREVKRKVPVVRSAYVDPRSSEEEIREIIAIADSVQAVVAGVFVRWSDHKGSISLPDMTVALLREFFEVDKPMAVISFGSPYILRQIPNVPSYLCAYGTVPLAVRSATRAIFGENPIDARIPVSLPGHYKAGDGLRREAHSMELVVAIEDEFLHGAYDVLQKAINDSVFPGAQVAVVDNGRLIASRGFGRQTYDEDSPEVDTQTIYDLASVTKVAATTVCAMRLWERRKLLLDIPVSAYLPKFKGADKDSITLRHLLTHSSGVHWWADLWNQATSKEEALDYIYQLPLDYAPGDSMIYSDLGLILVGKILETVTGKTIDELSQSLIFEPMGMKNTRFNPERALLKRIAPTEIGGNLNRLLIHGDVHDENAHFLDGVSTHAGLFSTAEDLAALAQMLLNGGIYRHHRFFSPKTIEYWTARQQMPEGSIRALGWVTPADEGSSSGDYFARGSFGHTGFTGTSIWIDPHRQIAIILLTNRVHPTRERGGMHQVRRDFHNAAMTALLRQMGQDVPDREPEVSNH